MPAAAFQLFLFFTVVAIVIGLGAWWIVGPRRPLAAILPVLARSSRSMSSATRAG